MGFSILLLIHLAPKISNLFRARVSKLRLLRLWVDNQRMKWYRRRSTNSSWSKANQAHRSCQSLLSLSNLSTNRTPSGQAPKDPPISMIQTTRVSRAQDFLNINPAAAESAPPSKGWDPWAKRSRTRKGADSASLLLWKVNRVMRMNLLWAKNKIPLDKFKMW